LKVLELGGAGKSSDGCLLCVPQWPLASILDADRIERTYVNCEAIDRRPSLSVGARRRQRRASPFMAAEFGVNPVHTGARDRSSGKLPLQFS
jgi:hypothetical protein